MKLKLGEEKFKGFSNPVRKAERRANWFWILLILTVVVTAIIALRKIL